MQVRGSPTRLTADAVAGISGVPTVLYACNLISGATAAVLNLRNGTGTGDPALINFTGTVSAGVMIPGIPSNGLLFPAGLFVDVDANTTAVTVWHEAVRNV